MTKLIIELPSWEVNKNDLAEIANKMQAIAISIDDELNIDDEITIEADLSNQYDEFYITATNEEKETRNICYIEVVTREVAISNDKELLKMSGSNYTIQEIESDYEVGNTLSNYKRLGDTVYYYKEM